MIDIQDKRMSIIGEIINTFPIPTPFKQLLLSKWCNAERKWEEFYYPISRIGRLTLYKIKGLFIKGKCKRCVFYFPEHGCCDPEYPEENMKENDYCQDFNYGISFKLPRDSIEREDF